MLNLPLRYLPSSRKELRKRQTHHSAAVPGLFQLLCELRRNFVQGRDVFILELDGHFDEPMLMFTLFVMSVGMMLMAAVLVVLMFLMSAHTTPSFPHHAIQKLIKNNCCLSQSRKVAKDAKKM
jgi:hypothetical protein